MLRVTRRQPAPLFFSEIDEPRGQLLRWANRLPEERRQRRAPIDFDMFRSGHVVDMVTADFEGRCAFCERDIGTSEGIGHFRPLSEPEEEASPDFRDHYAWLAYEWLNLILICQRCQKMKGNHFPVSDMRARYLATFDEVRAAEKPLLIDPTRDNPASHLSYLITGECLPRRTSVKGNATVAILELNETSLVDERRRAICDMLDDVREALRKRQTLPSHFLRWGPFLGACRHVVVSLLADNGLTDFKIGNGRALVQGVQQLIDDDRMNEDRLVASIQDIEEADQIRAVELQRRPPVRSDFSIVDMTRGIPLANLVAPRADIASITIRNFKAIDTVKITLQKLRSTKSGAPCLLLLGENAVGKSTCLAAFALALLGVREARSLRLPYRQLARSAVREGWDVWTKTPIEVEIGLHDEKTRASFFYDPARGTIAGSIEQTAVVLGYGPHRFFAAARGRRGSRASTRVRSLFDPRRPLPDPTQWLNDLTGRAFDEVAGALRLILPIGDDEDLVVDRQAGICVLAQGQLTPIAQLSEGYRSMVAMVADICRSLLDHWPSLQTARAVVLIDEIETHLHPRWKMQIMSSLREAFPAVQFIATTHDPLCVRGMDDGEVVVLARDGKGGIQLVPDLPSIEGMRVEQLLTSEYFGLSSTVDPDLQLEIARLAQGSSIASRSVLGEEADALIDKLTVGDSAAAQIIQEALLKYLRDRDRPGRSLSSSARADAVATVFRALRTARTAQ